MTIVTDGANIFRGGEPERLCGMTDDQQFWGCAIALHKSHGLHAPRFIAERIGALALAKDMQGVAAWKEIAARLDKLLEGTSAVH